MMAATRRAILHGVSMLPIARIVTEPGLAEADARILALCRDYEHNRSLFHVFSEDDEWDRLAEIGSELCRQIAAEQATTHAGLEAKALIVARETGLDRVIFRDAERWPTPGDFDDTQVLASLLRDLLECRSAADRS